MASLNPLWRVLAVITFFSILCAATAFTLAPQPDEAVYANPGYNLAWNGHMGTTLYELRGFMPLSMARRTYWQPPVYFLISAGWFRLVGFGLLQVRLLSEIFGILALISWYGIVKYLFRSPAAGLIAMALVSVDLFFVQGSAFGRMDLMCAGFGAASLASYLLQRERSLAWSLFLSHIFATLAILTHPVGVLYWLGVVFLFAVFDRRSLSMRVLASGAVGPALGAALWGAFILQDSPAFFDQMRGIVENVRSSFGGPGLSSIPLIRSVQLELRYRYVAPFGLGAGVHTAQRLKAIILAAYIAAIFGSLVVGIPRRHRGLVCLAVLTMISATYLAVASPSKYYYYLPHVCMFMAACLGGALFYLGTIVGERWSITLLLALVGLQLFGELYRIRQNPYQRSYLPVVEQIREHTTPRSLIMAPGEFWFGLERDRYMINDYNLGGLSGRTPDLFVMDDLYRSLHQRLPVADPDTYQLIEKLLSAYRLIYRNSEYEVYIR